MNGNDVSFGSYTGFHFRLELRKELSDEGRCWRCGGHHTISFTVGSLARIPTIVLLLMSRRCGRHERKYITYCNITVIITIVVIIFHVLSVAF